MKFSLISSTKKHLELSGAKWITLPTKNGEIGIYPGHVPVVGALQPGILKVDLEWEVQTFAIGWGVFETDGKHLDVLADMVDDGASIDSETLQTRKQEAQNLMEQAQKKWVQNIDEYIKAEQELNKIGALEQLSAHR